jgi:uncharacterized membrane protein YkvA (DUF1232 family)
LLLDEPSQLQIKKAWRGTMLWQVAIGAGIALACVWIALVLALWLARPDSTSLLDALRLLPDLLRLLHRVATDKSVRRSRRIGLWLLLGYLALPIDLIPDFIPVLGYADDAIVVALMLRWVARGVGTEVLARHWPGTPEGFDAVTRLVGIP